HGVTVEALRFALLAASTFDGVIKADNDDTPGDAHRYQESEQQSTGGKRRPHGPVQDALGISKTNSIFSRCLWGRTPGAPPPWTPHRILAPLFSSSSLSKYFACILLICAV